MDAKARGGGETNRGPDEHLELVWAECEGKGGRDEGPDGWRARQALVVLVWPQMLYGPPQMSCWSSSGAVRGGGKGKNALGRFISQKGSSKTAKPL